jgi:hypothetical protein
VNKQEWELEEEYDISSRTGTGRGKKREGKTDIRKENRRNRKSRREIQSATEAIDIICD